MMITIIERGKNLYRVYIKILNNVRVKSLSKLLAVFTVSYLAAGCVLFTLCF